MKIPGFWVTVAVRKAFSPEQRMSEPVSHEVFYGQCAGPKEFMESQLGRVLSATVWSGGISSTSGAAGRARRSW